jgi:hypothetical protein
MCKRKFGKLIIDRPGELRFQSTSNDKARRWASVGLHNVERIVRTRDYHFAAIQSEGDALVATRTGELHFDRTKRGRFDINIEFLCGSYENVAAIGLASQDGREEADHLWTPNWGTLVKPSAIACDTYARMAAMFGIPAFYRWQAAFFDMPFKLGEAYSVELDRRATFGHQPAIGLLRRTAQGRSSRK